ncbi:hypothetical protein LCGC14_0805350 [marine sediment metagenome]|uniref:ATP-dependent Clp protease proteolytic subunit n=1 Tax=marine sediment metagenome TaxID=412755 RepID=A0A0F9PNG0_9ZZZZ
MYPKPTFESPTPPTADEGPRFIAPTTVEAINNHVYFYADVNSDRGLTLLQRLREADNFLRSEHISRALPPDFPPIPIWLHINSWGGSVTDGFAISDQIKQIQTPIYSIVEGMCASAATFISMACSQRYIQPSAYMLIHELSAFMWGTYTQIKDDVKLLDMMIERITTFYLNNSTLKREDVEKSLKHNTWFNADMAIKAGMVDNIYGNA